MRRETVERQWKRIQSFVVSPRMLSGLPSFAQDIAIRFYDHDSHSLVKAMREGDVATFLAMLVRLDQLLVAAQGCGRSVAEIAPIVRCKGTAMAWFEIAVEQLKEKGGAWPLTSPEEPEGSPASHSPT